MGAWGHGNFDNDTAADYAADFQEDPNETTLLETLTAVAEEGYPEADEASEALAAAEIIAAALGKAARGFPEDLLPTATSLHLTSSDPAKRMARRAIKAILKKSELKELWEESAEYASWTAVQEGLLDRLA
jgi:pantoate kinase